MHRYKQLIEAQLTDSTSKSSAQAQSLVQKSSNENMNQDMMNELTIQNHISNCIQNVNTSAQLHGEFWMMLKDDKPNLAKLAETGFRISFYNQEAEDQYNKLLKMNALVPSIMIVYARFHQEILNDNQQTDEIYRQLNILLQK